MTDMLAVRDLHTYYGDSHILRGLNFDIGEGEVVTLLGRNGMGKTTTIKSIMGIVRPRAGSIELSGKRLEHLRIHEVARAGIGLVPEGREIFPNLTVVENLIAMRANRNGTRQPWTLERVFELFPSLAARRSQLGTFLSGGEQQMLAIGRALMTNPRLLILDEATEGLAPILRNAIWNSLRLLKQLGQAALIVDKNTKALTAIADRIYVMEKGRIVWSGKSAQFAAEPTIREQYLGL
jgi:branched-chain amino acid transport system ATP-binding protein